MLVRNSARDAGLSGKYTPRYTGPYVVDQITKGGAYVLQELDGTFLRQGFAAFRLLPYKPRIPRDLNRKSHDQDEMSSEEESETSLDDRSSDD